MDLILQKQGVSWLVRRAISWATITITVKHYKDDEGLEHIDIQQTLTGGMGGTTEERTLDWEPRTHEDNVFGAVIGKSRRIQVGDIEDEFLKQNWLPDVIKHGAIDAYAESDTPKSNMTWTAEQVRLSLDTARTRQYETVIVRFGDLRKSTEKGDMHATSSLLDLKANA
jgi:hypothetical protein